MKFQYKRLAVGLLTLVWLQLDVQAQDLLQRTISYQWEGSVSRADALDQIAKDQGFYFSYLDTAISAKQPLRLTQYSGSLQNFLYEALGDKFDFKELPGYVIIRYAPGILDFEAETDVEARQVTVEGYVRDKRTGAPVAHATVYDKSRLKSVLTDEAGYFNIRVKSAHAVWLTLSKEQYKDTTFMILPAVEIEASRKKNMFRYYQEDGSSGEVEESFLGRMFIGFRQRVQRINLGGFFAESPFQMSLAPGLSSQGMFNSQMINKFSLNILGGYTAGVDGFEAAGIFNINQRDVHYFQMAGAVNVVGGEGKGFQAAGVSNTVLKGFSGVQVAGVINDTKKEVKGLQVAGIINLAKAKTGHQIAGLLNRAKEARGVQLAGLANWASDCSEGIQVAGIFNQASTGRHQIAGFVNRAESIKGIQLGLVNIARESSYPVGLLNFIQDGRKSLSLQVDESALTTLTFRSGGKILYGVLGAGYGGAISPVYGLETGLGAHLADRQRYALDAELVGQVINDFSEVTSNATAIRLLNGLKVSPRWKLFLAPTLSFQTYEKQVTSPYKGVELARWESDQRFWLFELRAMAGLQYVF
ncbi:MAG TPA: carboxypeptidase-like regulatory domain-containing protein [Cyclobacteriaceae bacterium]|nr:carboxypeptidase-like regulatory domain-containing protein [Cyclobacteriaceae bacterium]